VLTDDEFDLLRKDEVPRIAWGVAENRNLTEAQMQRIEEDENLKLRGALAPHPRRTTPVDRLERMAGDSTPYVRRLVTENSVTLVLLGLDPNHDQAATGVREGSNILRQLPLLAVLVAVIRALEFDGRCLETANQFVVLSPASSSPRISSGVSVFMPMASNGGVRLQIGGAQPWSGADGE
jgi:hypothetical protein